MSEKDIEIVKNYIAEGRRTIPVQLVKSLLEKLEYYHARNSDYLDVIVDIMTKFGQSGVVLQAVKLPNKDTLQAVEQLESGKGVTFNNTDELFEDLEKKET